jgi:hypothetical protein
VTRETVSQPMRRRAVRLTFIPFQSERRFDSEREEGERGRSQQDREEREGRGSTESGTVVLLRFHLLIDCRKFSLQSVHAFVHGPHSVGKSVPVRDKERRKAENRFVFSSR